MIDRLWLVLNWIAFVLVFIPLVPVTIATYILVDFNPIIEWAEYIENYNYRID